MGIWLLVFFLTPIIEMYLLIRVGGYIGAWPTIGATIFTAALGAILVRRQGRRALDDARADLDRGAPPVAPAVHGLFLLIAGALLLTPGFISDSIGFARVRGRLKAPKSKVTHEVP